MDGTRGNHVLPQKIIEYRRTMMNNVALYLLDLDQVAKELLKDKGIPHSKTLLEHLLESIKKLSPNFFVGIEEQITPNSTQGFLLWLLVRLFSVTSCAKCSSLHQLASQCVAQLFKVCSNAKEIKLFQLIVNELLEMLRVLSTLASNLKEPFRQIYLTHFQYSVDGYMESDALAAPIPLGSLEDNACLISAVLSVIQENSGKIALHIKNAVKMVAPLNILMKYGGMRVKRDVVATIAKCAVSGWPLLQEDNLTSSVLCVAELYVKNVSKKTPDLLDLLRGPLVDFLQLLTPQNTCGKNWERITHLLLFSLETPNVQYMEQMFADCMASLLNKYVQMAAPSSQMELLGKAAVGMIGKGDCLQFLAPCIVMLCGMEASKSAVTFKPPPKVSDRSGVVEPKAKKTKVVGKSPLVTTYISAKATKKFKGITGKLAELSVTMATKITQLIAISEKDSNNLFSLREGIDWSEVYRLLEGVRLVFEVQVRHLLGSKVNSGLWWSTGHMTIMCSAMECAMVASVCSGDTDLMKKVFVKVCEGIGALYSVDLWSNVHLPPLLLDHTRSLLSLCWPKFVEASWGTVIKLKCFPSEIHQKVLTYMSTEDGSMDLTDCQIESLYAFSCMPSSVKDQTALECMRLALSSPNSQVRCTALGCIPLWQGAGEHIFTQQLVHLSKNLHGCSPDVVESFFCCVLSLIPPGVTRTFTTDPWSSPLHRITQVERLPLTEEARVAPSEDVLTLFSGVVGCLTSSLISSLPGSKSAFLTELAEVCSRLRLEDQEIVLHNVLALLFSNNANVIMFAGKILAGFAKANSKHVSIITQQLQKALQSKCFRCRKAVVSCFVCVACSCSWNVAKQMVLKLLEMLQDPVSEVRGKVLKEGRVIIDFHGNKTLTVFDQLKYDISELLAAALHRKPETVWKDGKYGFLLQETVNLFKLRQEKKKLDELFGLMYQSLVYLLSCKGLEVMESLTSRNTKEVVGVQFKYIYAYIVRRCTTEELPNKLLFLEETLQVKVNDFFKSNPFPVCNELSVHLAHHEERVKNGMYQVVMATKGETHGPVNRDSRDKEIVEFVKPQLLGVLAVLNRKFIAARKYNSEEQITSVIKSLIIWLRMMGKENVVKLRVMVMGMLRVALQSEPSVIKVVLQGWNCFIRNLSMESLGPLLSQLIVTLSPFIDIWTEIVADIFHYLIVENRDALFDHFIEVHSLPKHPALEEVNQVLHHARKKDLSLPEHIDILLKSVTHEQSVVKQDALDHLLVLLKENRGALNDCITSVDRADQSISRLVSTLVQSSSDRSLEVRERVGRCLGEIGAIDPARLNFSSEIMHAKPHLAVEMDSLNDKFAVHLLQELGRAFLSAEDTRGQDCCAYAIQEVLATYDCANRAATTSMGYLVWCSLSSEIQDILHPFLYSHYTADNAPKKRTIPIYKLDRRLTFHHWIISFVGHLVEKVEDGLAKRVFNACSVMFKYYSQVPLFLLPFVVIKVLCSQKPDTDVSSEMIEIINVACQHGPLTMGQSDCLTHCCQTIFTVLDHLNHWTRNRVKVARTKKLSKKATESSAVQDSLENVDKVANFQFTLPKDKLARAAYNCKAYARALLYMEEYMATLDKEDTQFQETLGFCQKVYVALDNQDGVTGLSRLRRGNASFQQKMLEYEGIGQYSEAVECYSMAIQKEPNEYVFYEGVLKCKMEMGQFESVLARATGWSHQKPEWMQQLNSFRVEAAWRLCRWDQLEEFLTNDKTTGNWSVGLGRVLLAAKQKNGKLFERQLKLVQTEQLGPLSAASMELGSYQRAYQNITRLHMLNELEEGASVLLGLNGRGSQDEKQCLLDTWRMRLGTTQASYRAREPILSLRRLLFGLVEDSFKEELGKLWLQSAELAGKSGILAAAACSLEMARSYSLAELPLLKAKLLHRKGNPHEALTNLQKEVQDKWTQDLTVAHQQRDAPEHSKALLYIGRWMEDTAYFETQTILKQYKSAVSVHPEFEMGHFYLAKYYDRLMSVWAEETSKHREFLPFVLLHYGETLRFGNKFIYQSMPRLLSLWLDFGAEMSDPVPSSGKLASSERASSKKTLDNLNATVSKLTKELPPYQFLMAYSQLVSRICHPNSIVFSLIKAIILKLIAHYPQQLLWMLMAVSKSTHSDRQQRCQRILNEAKSGNVPLAKLITDMTKLSERLVDVCNKPVDSQVRGPITVSMDKICRGLSRLLSDKDFSDVIVPIQSSLTVTLPLDGDGHYGNHNPFPGYQPTIVRFEDHVEVLMSLVRPKKVTVLASDGKKYTMMCKPDDDLRKDSRLMELYSLINRFLRKNIESRERNLYIRTYSVVPLNEKCGLIEWVNNMTVLRQLLTKMYQDQGKMTPLSEVKELYNSKINKVVDPSTSAVNFKKFILPKFPPMLGLWFKQTFPDPTQWYYARLAYIRTTAVMSIVGYVLGLGDRHGENLLFDSTNGDILHVDFNCLFGKGETFEYPEVVPFRLTHNLVDAMGVTGYEGDYRRCCEVTMHVLREQCDPLICVLKTLVHDPLVEWKKKGGAPDTVHDRAVNIIKSVEQRMQGKSLKTKGLPLSIEGLVQYLIQSATSLENLSRMYIGWAAYL